jgi:predicted RNase H-like HicB family nuclease
MIRTQSLIIVSKGPCESHGTAQLCVHHRDFPENWTQGETLEIAARHLLNLFSKNLDSVGSSRHRETVERAIADLQEFLAELDEEGPGLP